METHIKRLQTCPQPILIQQPHKTLHRRNHPRRQYEHVLKNRIILNPPHLQHHIAMDLLTPKAGSKIIAILLYMPQRNTTQGNMTYNEALQWLNKTLAKDLPHAAAILGGDLQATLSAKHPSHNQELALFCTSTCLRPLGDSCTSTFTPTSSPLDHWLLRLPAHICDTI